MGSVATKKTSCNNNNNNNNNNYRTPSQNPVLRANIANSMTDWWMDGRTDGQMDSLSHILTVRGIHVASLVKFRQVGGRKNNVAPAHPYHEENSCSRSGLGGHSMTARWMDGWPNARQTRDGKTMLLSHTLTMRGRHVVSLVKFRPVV